MIYFRRTKAPQRPVLNTKGGGIVFWCTDCKKFFPVSHFHGEH